jgi:hypothetical protein
MPDPFTIAGGVLAAITLAAGARNRYRRTLGRRSDYTARVQRLGAGAHLSFFTSVIGEPPAIRRTATRPHDQYGRPFREAIYIDPLFYVQAIVDQDETVLSFAVTTRDKRFRPGFLSPGYTVEMKRDPGCLRGARAKSIRRSSMYALGALGSQP